MSVERMAIIDSTLREGEQFAGADFTTDQKLGSSPPSTSSGSITSR